jgi:putative flavoprotein involved in K+ transport
MNDAAAASEQENKGMTIDQRSSRAAHLIEEGAAFMELSGLSASQAASPRRAPGRRDEFDVIVIGAGQAGLSVGHYLAKHGMNFVILDANARIGDSWRKRWDSLRLFTPAKFDGLDGMPFPAPPNYFPTKDEMGDYLEAYAARFELPVRTGVKVDRLRREGRRYVLEAGGVELEADHVVVAMANWQGRRVPAFAQELDSEIVQLHSCEYKNPAQLKPGATLIVGAGNSGSEIAMELSKTRRTFMSGRHVGQVPFRVGGFWGRLFLLRLVLRVLFHRVASVKTPLGRKLRVKMLTQGGPLIRVKLADLAAAGVERVGRVAGVESGRPVLEDGRVLDVENVVWCTGYDSALSWIDLPIWGEYGEPRHEDGVVTEEPGLYFVGRLFLHAASSVMVHGVGRDAARIAHAIAARTRLAPSSTRGLPAGSAPRTTRRSAETAPTSA